MKVLAALLIFLLSWPALAAEHKTAVTVDGISYVHIQDVHVSSGGRIVLLNDAGGATLPADKLPADFLHSWNINPEDIAQSKAAAQKLAEESLTQAIRAGYFREVDGVIYDLRKAQPGWRTFSGAKVLEVTQDGALIDTSGRRDPAGFAFIHNLPRIYADNEHASSFMAKSTGDFSFVSELSRVVHTIHAYDIGRVCERNEIPAALLTGVAAAARVRPYTPHLGEAPYVSTEPSEPNSPLTPGLRAIGSGFFVTKDGYFITNYHVVRNAHRLEVKYKLHVFKASVVQVDTLNDLAVIKVEGNEFSTLAISHKPSDLGDEVFTIGFPNIDMQGLEPKYTDGKISSLAGMRDDPTEYQISVPVQPGNSGGPLCDTDGNVVGIVVARLNDLAALRESGAVPQNVNYAVKSKHALQLLQNVPGLENLVTPGRADPKSAKPVQTVESAIGMVMIY